MNVNVPELLRYPCAALRMAVGVPANETVATELPIAVAVPTYTAPINPRLFVPLNVLPTCCQVQFPPLTPDGGAVPFEITWRTKKSPICAGLKVMVEV